VHQALAAERHQVGLGRDPVAQRRRPLLRPAQVERLLARHDRAAVGDPDDDRGRLAGGHRGHHLVDQRHALGGLAQPGQGLPLADPRQRRQVGVAEALADLAGLPEGGVGGRGVAGGEALQRDRQQQVALLDAVELAVVQQPPGPGQPAAAAGQLAAVQELQAQPERAPGGPRRVAGAEPPLERPRPRVGGVVVAADQEGGHREPLEVRRHQRRAAVQGRELGVGRRPVMAAVRVPGPVERAGRGHQRRAPSRSRCWRSGAAWRAGGGRRSGGWCRTWSASTATG
jgi:hypothetical protein